MGDRISASLNKVEALLRAAEGRGLGMLEYAEAGMSLRVAFDTGAAAENAPPSALPGIFPSSGEMPGRAEGGSPQRTEAPHPTLAQEAVIVSPGVGFLRCSHGSGGKFPGEGEKVAAGTVVAAIQAGPLLQPVTAPRTGRLGRMLVAEGAGVGFGTTLFEFI